MNISPKETGYQLPLGINGFGEYLEDIDNALNSLHPPKVAV